MGIAAFLLNDREPFEQIVNTLSTEGPCEMWSMGWGLGGGDADNP